MTTITIPSSYLEQLIIDRDATKTALDKLQEQNVKLSSDIEALKQLRTAKHIKTQLGPMHPFPPTFTHDVCIKISDELLESQISAAAKRELVLREVNNALLDTPFYLK